MAAQFRADRTASPRNHDNLVGDIGLQQLVEQEYEGRRGALVAIDPKSGEILAAELVTRNFARVSYVPETYEEGTDADRP